MAEKILIVDDDVDSLKLIGLMLQRHGYEVVAANAGSQALVKANNERPDLIILDIMMPDMDGYEVCRRLRAEDITKDIPIIMFTAKTLIDDKVAGFEAGADDYLTKPTHPTELAARVKSMLERTNNKVGRGGSSRGSAVGVLGVKGGIGATTITFNLGAALLNMENNPVVADFRLGTGSLGLSMGLGRSSSMANVLGQAPEEVSTEMIQRELVKHQSGLRALLSSSRPREALIEYNPNTARAVVQQIRSIAKTAVYDLGSGFSPLNSKLLPDMDRIVMLVDPAGVSLSMAREMLQELGKVGRERINLVVVNRTQLSQQPPWHEVEHVLEHEIRAIISAAPELAFQAMEAGTAIVNYQPNAIVSNQIGKLAEELAETE